MPVQATISVKITPGAEARIVELGIERAVEEMLEHTRQTVTGLREIEIEGWEDPNEGWKMHLTMLAWREGGGLEECYEVIERWNYWFVRAFPSEVIRWWSFFVLDRESDER